MIKNTSGRFKDWVATNWDTHNEIEREMQESIKCALKDKIDNISAGMGCFIQDYIDQNVLEWCSTLFENKEVYITFYDHKPCVKVDLVNDWDEPFCFGIEIEKLFSSDFDEDDAKVIASELRKLADQFDGIKND